MFDWCRLFCSCFNCVCMLLYVFAWFCLFLFVCVCLFLAVFDYLCLLMFVVVWLCVLFLVFV